MGTIDKVQVGEVLLLRGIKLLSAPLDAGEVKHPSPWGRGGMADTVYLKSTKEIREDSNPDGSTTINRLLSKNSIAFYLFRGGIMIEDWLENNIEDNIKYTGNGREVHFNCVVCGDSRHRMYVNLQSGAVYCHNCEYRNNIVGLIQYVEGVSRSRAMCIFNDIKGNFVLPEHINKDIISNMFIGDLRKHISKRAIPLPDEYSSLNPNKTNIRTARAIRYLHTRGITDVQIVEHKMGFCYDGEYRDRIIIPITQDGEIVFWIARAIGTEAKMKEKSPSSESYQISKSEVIFNLDRAAKKYHSAVICEGIFDALSFGDIGVSLLGKSLYQEQLNILLDYRDVLTNGVYVALDYDAKYNALNIAKVLSEYFTTYIVNIPEYADDPNRCFQLNGRNYMYKLIEDADEYGEFSVIRGMLS